MWVSSFAFKSDFILTGGHDTWVIMKHKNTLFYILNSLKILLWVSFHLVTLRALVKIYRSSPQILLWFVARVEMQNGVRCMKSSAYHWWSKKTVFIPFFSFLTSVNLFCKYHLSYCPFPPSALILWPQVRVLVLPKQREWVLGARTLELECLGAHPAAPP